MSKGSMPVENSDERVIVKSWETSQGIVTVIFESDSLYFQINNGEKSSVIPNHLVNGLQKSGMEALSKEGVTKILENAHIRLKKMSDSEYTLEIVPNGLGGGNTINPSTEKERLWGSAIVPYEIDTKTYPVAEDERKIILSAIKKWNASNTGFTLVPRTSTKQQDYLIFGEAEDICQSNVGRQGGAQYIRCDLDGGGFNEGSILHEIGHTVGLYHEHKRSDRDEHVSVSAKKVKEKPADYKKDGYRHGEYDFYSIMHYPLSVGELSVKSIYNKYDMSFVGQRKKLSEGDLAATRYLAKHAKEVQHQVFSASRSSASSSQFPFFGSKVPLFEQWTKKADKALKEERHKESAYYYLNLYKEYQESVNKKTVSNWCACYGHCQEQLGDMVEAKTAYENALRFYPQHSYARQQLDKITEAMNPDPEFCCIL